MDQWAWPGAVASRLEITVTPSRSRADKASPGTQLHWSFTRARGLVSRTPRAKAFTEQMEPKMG